jgi:hypothetical protein
VVTPEEVLALPARTATAPARVIVVSVVGRAREAESPAKSRWHHVLGWLGIGAGALAFVKPLLRRALEMRRQIARDGWWNSTSRRRSAPNLVSAILPGWSSTLP